MTNTQTTQSPGEPRPDALWAVMRAQSWDSITITANGNPLSAPIDGPQRFIPVFNTREQAVKWHGSEDDVVAMCIGNKEQI